MVALLQDLMSCNKFWSFARTVILQKVNTDYISQTQVMNIDNKLYMIISVCLMHFFVLDKMAMLAFGLMIQLVVWSVNGQGKLLTYPIIYVEKLYSTLDNKG